MTLPSAKQMQEIRDLIKMLSLKPCIQSAHGKGRVCAPCEARLRVAREDKGRGSIAPEKDDIWLK